MIGGLCRSPRSMSPRQDDSAAATSANNVVIAGAASSSSAVVAGLPSQYLHVTESSGNPPTPPPLAVFTSKAAVKQPTLQHMYSVERRTASPPTGRESDGATSLQLDSHLYVNNGMMASTRSQCRRHSHSDDNLASLHHYARMSGDSQYERMSPTDSASVMLYCNSSNDRLAATAAATASGVYSYARNFDMEPVQLVTGAVNGRHEQLTKTNSSPTLLNDDNTRSRHDSSRPHGNAGRHGDRLSDATSSPPLRPLPHRDVSRLSDTSTSSAPYARISNGSSLSDAVSSPLPAGGVDAASLQGRMSDGTQSPPSSTVSSPPVVSPVAGISMTTRSRVFTRHPK